MRTAAGRDRMRVHLPLLATGAAAWLALVLRPGGMAHGPPHPAHGTMAALVAEAALMFAAMMVPLMGAPVRHVRNRSFARRRVRAVALFVAGYALPWIAITVTLMIAARWMVAARSPAVLAIAVAAVAVWHAAPHRQRCLNRTHAHPELAAFGPEADLDALRFGLSHAGWCMGSCGALMLMPMLFIHGHLSLMAAATLWLAGDRLAKPVRPRWRWPLPSNFTRIVIALGQEWRARLEKHVLISRASTLQPGS